VVLPGGDAVADCVRKLEASRIETSSIGALISELAAIRASMVKLDNDCARQRSTVDPAWRKSVENLLHNLALRHHDIRPLQEKLARLGLSSLGRTESHVMSTLDAVLSILHRLNGQASAVSAPTEDLGFNDGNALLAAHTEALLGPAPSDRGVRIMVTMSTKAADDYALVRDLVARGMNCMRINCAHDTPEAWSKMVANLERARRELSLPCSILMDLAGPKLRTGTIEPGPPVLVWHPHRDRFGHVLQPARVWLTAEGTPEGAPDGADACLQVSADWLVSIQPGERINFLDARGKRRILQIAESSGAGRWAHCDQTAYAIAGMQLSRAKTEGRGTHDTIVGSLPPLQQTILLKKGDELVLTRDDLPGSPALIDAAGRTISPATISCTLPEIFAQVQIGESVWLNDGKIGGTIRTVQDDAIHIEITHAKPKGERLGADKGINLPDTNITLPALTPKDVEDLRFLVDHADLVGMSFVRFERDIYELQARLLELKSERLGIVLKIETRQAFERLPNLILAAMRAPRAGVMIARGDLAVECGYQRTAEVQEEILWICEAAHMPVIWATQVLESLAKKGQASRAEITDAAMGERAECVMLNKGPYIVEAVKVLDDILHRMQGHQAKKSARLRPLRLELDQATAEPE
jgi:pyruvate kinase